MFDQSEEMGEGLVIDNGSSLIKAGYSSDQKPRVVFSTNIDDPFHTAAEVKEDKENSRIKTAIEMGIVANWDAVEKIWYHTFYKELKVAPEDHPLVLSDAPLNAKANREKMVKVMFESFDVPLLYIANQAALALYASGRASGIVLDCGHCVTHACPVVEGFAMPHAILQLEYAGRDINAELIKILGERGYSFTTEAELEIVRDIKEKVAYVAADYDKELQLAEESSKLDQNFELPDGQVITVGSGRFRCTELLFQPSLIDLEQSGVHQALSESIQKCDVDLRKDLYGNVILAGGSTLFQGMDNRITRELNILAPKADVKVIAPENRAYSVWIGGTILSSLSSFQKMFVSREEYAEVGASIVHKKCF